jgi:hypothetical protein
MWHERQSWERVRWLGCLLFNTQVESKHRKEPREILPFVWDNEEGRIVELPTNDDIKKIIERDKKIMEKEKNG